MNVLFLGDIVGKLGRQTVKKILPQLKKDIKLDLVLANSENIAHGKGVTKSTLQELKDAGVDVFTSGNHVWKKDNGLELLKENPDWLLRPANYPPGVPGLGYSQIKIGKEKILIISLIGRVFMHQQFDCPFRKFDEIVKKHKRVKNIIVDIHAEATSEKVALAHYIKDRASLLIGTHTHVPTADAQIIDNKLGYVTDAGMVGSKNSILGVDKEVILKKFLTQLPEKHKMVDTGQAVFNSVLTKIKDGKTVEIKRIDREAF